MLQRPSYEMSVTAMAPSQFEFETPALENIHKYRYEKMNEIKNKNKNIKKEYVQ